MEFNFSKYINTVKDFDPIAYVGYVSAVSGKQIISNGPVAQIGEICTIKFKSGKEIFAEVVGLNKKDVLLTPYGDTEGIEIGCEVVGSGKTLQVPVGMSLLGRTIDATGKPCDGLGEITPEAYYPALNVPPDPMKKKPINRRITTGVRSIDAMLTCGKGQRIGIFAGSGVGKSTLLGMIARNTDAQINVVGLIGERNREVLDFINNDLGKEGLKRSVVVVATGDQPAICRLRAAYVCTAIAEYFRDQGKDVMMMVDNVTRFAKAQLEIGISNGEPPTASGYPASVFSMIPALMERTGTSEKGTITAFYAVLVDGDDMDDPIADCVRGVLDGHIVLSRKLASAYHYPAVDVLPSISRLQRRVTGTVTKKAYGKIRELMSIYQNNVLMINSGIYQKGNSSSIDEAIDKYDEIEQFLKQDEYEKCTMKDTLDKLSVVSGFQIPQEEYTETPNLPISDVKEETESKEKTDDKKEVEPSKVDSKDSTVENGEV